MRVPNASSLNITKTIGIQSTIHWAKLPQLKTIQAKIANLVAAIGRVRRPKFLQIADALQAGAGRRIAVAGTLHLQLFFNPRSPRKLFD